MNLKENLIANIHAQRDSLCSMSDRIFDYAEPSFEEQKSAALLEDALEREGFTVERGIAGLPTAFRAVYGSGDGPRIGLLCEYDALKQIGHGCGHQLQGPAIFGAAKAVKDTLAQAGQPYTLVVYGTPGEETDGGKIPMLEQGCFRDIDVALMTHGGPATQTDIKSMAMTSMMVTYHGISSHAAIKPDAGRSALDALLLAFQGIEFMREHVKEDSRLSYTVAELPGPSNVVPDKAIGVFDLRSYNSVYLDKLIKRFENIVDGASTMTETSYEIQQLSRYESKIPVLALNKCLMDNAALVNAPVIRPVREKTGSTDFGNVTYEVPGSCIRIAFVPEGTPSHSQAFIDAGKTKEAHQAVLLSAQILAATVADLIQTPSLFQAVQEEFKAFKIQMNND